MSVLSPKPVGKLEGTQIDSRARAGGSLFRFSSTEGEDVERLRLQLLSSITKGERRVTVDVDPLPALDHVAVRTLITLLRIVRNAGGELVLHVTRPKLRASLDILGLDRVFCAK